MINDPQLQLCPSCGQSWAQHANRCRYYSRPQPTVDLTPEKTVQGLARSAPPGT